MDAALQQVLQCQLCASSYDYGEHAPHVMPCGHTAGLRCLQQLANRRCSECRQKFNFPLVKNFAYMNIVEFHVKEALTRRLEGVLPPGVQDQCSGEQALQALSLLQRDWELTLRGEERELTGTLQGGEDGDPLAAALCLLVAARTQLKEVRTNRSRSRSQSQRGRLPPQNQQPQK
ncbi:uncharacterized protein LOC113209834 [Frankliniella occidentalis]|uniref:Uncharacterized protein LOC113209834 n=1 Tax=Frankliniella occidentalis TaxID=133901 RepID=A0A6J1SPZ7_FRAOC|nr:uncharacterized protein LOC113209834 [Frankliniella occidentalis]XP_026283334.2 uncharacterized protein LOC113209834 [Frankliniella occidentalis]